MAAFEGMGVDFVLGGHVHQTHVRTSNDVTGVRDAPGIPLIACGTTTSRRGRGAEVDLNSLNVIRVAETGIEVVPHVLASEGAAFDPGVPVVLPRRARAAMTGHRSEGAS
jgi:hypothetical protein